MNRRSRHYRRSLGKNIGKEVTLECSEFKITSVDENGAMYMLLEKPSITKLSGKKVKNKWIINHLWVQIPENRIEYFEKYLSLMRKVQITGIVHEYQYENSGHLQAGVELANIQILKYRKDLAKKYKLRPGDLLSKKEMDNILEQEKNCSESIF